MTGEAAGRAGNYPIRHIGLVGCREVGRALASHLAPEALSCAP